MKPYRAFAYRYDPSMLTVIDGRNCYTTASALDLKAITPLPLYIPDSGEWTVQDARELEFKIAGRFGRFEFDPDMTPVGYHLPDAVTREIQAWCEEYVRAHPDEPLIPRAVKVQGHNNYLMTQVYRFSYNKLAGDFNADIEDDSRRVRAEQERRNSERLPGAHQTRGRGAPGRQPRASAENVAMAEESAQNSMFNEDGG